jgi:hypothetical protein
VQAADIYSADWCGGESLFWHSCAALLTWHVTDAGEEEPPAEEPKAKKNKKSSAADEDSEDTPAAENEEKGEDGEGLAKKSEGEKGSGEEGDGGETSGGDEGSAADGEANKPEKFQWTGVLPLRAYGLGRMESARLYAVICW